MKKIFVIISVLAGLFIASSLPARVLDAPHNASTGMSCTDCHVDPFNNFTYSDDICLACHTNASGGGYSLRSAPKVLTHSSQNTSEKYGTWSLQCLDCHSKHDYEQRASNGTAIFLATGSITSVTDNGDGTTTFGYANLAGSPLMPGWTDFTKWGNKSWGDVFRGNERGLILYPNTSTYQNQTAISFEVASATNATITVIGSIKSAFPSVYSAGTVTAGSPFGLAYGQFVNNSVVATDVTPTVLKPVAFFENTGYNSFAYSTAVPPSTKDPSVNSICQACHSYTLHWRKDGTLADHYNSQNCTTCHKHEEGFKLSCEGCHLTPPSTGKHSVHFDAGLAEYGTTGVQSIPTAYGFNCGTCHSGTHMNTTADPRTVEVNFAGLAKQGGAAPLYSASTFSIDDRGTGFAFNYSDGTCSSVYCHGNYSGSGKKASVTFETGTAVCGSCHDASNSAPPASGSHAAHASSSRSNLACTLCHNDEVGGAGPASYTVTDKQKHVNGSIDWSFDPGDSRVAFSTYSIPSGSVLPSDGVGRSYGTCSTTYCHSDGTSVATLNLQPNTSPVWGSGSLTCSSCHGAPPSYPNGSPKANSHQAHVSYSCSTCHINTTSNGITITNAASHVNSAYDVSPDKTAGINFTYTFSPNGGSCAANSCHGNNSSTWGSSVTCQNCHLGAADQDDFAGSFWNDNTTSILSSTEWATTGHGRPSGNYASGNPAALLTTLTGTQSVEHGCQFCHDPSIAHNQGANPFRLKGLDNAVWGKNGVCQSCHASDSAGISVAGVFRNGSRKVGAAHFGTKHTTTADGGQFCWDCHDPHGDGNAFMVQGAVAKASDPATGAPVNVVHTVFALSSPAAGSDYAKSSEPFNGICNVCHTATSHYTQTGGDGHNAGVNCTQCHAHDSNFKPSGDSCSDCHSSAGGPTPGTTPDAYHAKHVQTAYAGKVSTVDYGNYTTNQWYRYSNLGGKPDMGCGYCHPQNSATHMNGFINLNFDPGDAGAAGTLKAKNNPAGSYTQTSKASVTCSSVYCHSDGYASGGLYGYRTTPEWYGGSYTGDKCAGCHDNSPTGSSAHSVHVVGIHYQNIYTGTTGNATAGNTDRSSHGYADADGNELTATTISCNVCHYSTVTMTANDSNAVCAQCHTGTNLKGVMLLDSRSTSHVNGVVDVVFAPITIKSKAQIRDDIGTSPELSSTWTRTNGYKGPGSCDLAKQPLSASVYSGAADKTCSNVACHNNRSTSWNSTVSCNSCHTVLPQ